MSTKKIYSFKKNELKNFITKAKKSKNKIFRKIFHKEDSKEMQCMLIAFAPNKFYDYILDDIPGSIIFTCILGKLEISYFKKKIADSKTSILNEGEILVLPRNYFRSTLAKKYGAVYLESIEGPFLPEKRIVYKDTLQ